MLFNNITVKNKLIILGSVLVILSGISILAGLLEVSEMNREADIRFHTSHIFANFINERAAVRGYVLSDNPNYLKQFQEQRTSFTDQKSILSSLVTAQDLKQILSNLENREQNWNQNNANPLLDARKEFDAGSISQSDFLNKVSGLSDWDTQLDNIESNQNAMYQTMTVRMESLQSSTHYIMFSILASEIAIGVILTLIITRSISGPLKRLQDTTALASQGDLTHEITVQNSDEIGALGQAFANMTDGLRNIIRNIVATSSEVSSISQQVSSSTEQMNASTQQISSTVQQIARSSQNQAHEVEQVNKSIENLSSAMKLLESKADEMSKISSNMGNMAETGKKSASDASERIARIASVSEESVEKIRKMVERSAQITSVLDVIRKIADQTNLLALNAAIEAARAGESGKGFAVVADEVRKLAENSAKAAEEIDLQIAQIQEEAQNTVQGIENSSKEIVEGKEIIGKGLEALNDISVKVKETISIVDVVTSLIQDQSRVTDQIKRSAGEIASSAEENASGTEETASTMEEHTAGMEEITSGIQNLSSLSDQLLTLVKKFKIPEEFQVPPPLSSKHNKKSLAPFMHSVRYHGDGERKEDLK